VLPICADRSSSVATTTSITLDEPNSNGIISQSC
jgi:hypothetical protein